METKVNKAKELRDRQNTEYINADLRRKLLEFENEYLNSAVSYEFSRREREIKHFQKLIVEFPTRKVTKQNQRDTVRNYQYRIDSIQKELDLDATLTMKTLVETKKSFDQKVNRVVSVLVEEGFGYAHYNVEKITDKGAKLAFLISKSDKVVHARLIWVDGIEVTPHFRFITTTRKIVQ